MKSPKHARLVFSAGNEHTGHQYALDDDVVGWAVDILSLAEREELSVEVAGEQVSRSLDGGFPLVPGRAVKVLAVRLARLWQSLGSSEWRGNLKISNEELTGRPTREELHFQMLVEQMRRRRNDS